MAVGVDQPGQQGPPAGVDPLRDPRGACAVAGADQLHHLAVVADDDPGEALQPALRVDLDALGIVHQRVGQGSGGNGGEEQRGGCDRGGVAWATA